ncbi:hypothetical protein Q3G72_013687 [Acer saccharum]|nr:hypothetical protein Q3G72_013687 [Acer saccharum]
MIVVDGMLNKLGELVFTSLLNQAQFALDFKSELDTMKTQLEVLKAFLSDTDNLKSKKEQIKTTLAKIRELFYEADNILTDCLIRDEYRSDGSCSSYSPQELIFKYQIGQKLKNINSQMEKMERILSAFLKPQYPSIQGDTQKILTRFTSQDFDPSEIIGLESDMEKIKGWIFSKNEALHRVDSEIRAQQLIHWWVGEGFIQDKDTKTATEQGFEYLSELVSRCLVDVVQRRGYDGRVYSCKMHDLVRDMTIKVSEDEAFCSFDGKGKQKLTADSRWLGFTSDLDTKSLNKNLKLRAMLLMSGNPVFFNKSNVVLRSLRVLDCSHCKLDTTQVENLMDLICSLKRLACLNLSGVVGLKEVPYSIKKLCNLQLLILTGCNNLVKLHQSITNLKRLVILDLGSCGHEYLPREVGRLSYLQELSGLRLVNNAQSCRLHDLEALVQLRVLRINVNNESEITEEERKVLSQLQKLKVFSIDAEDCKDEKIFKMLDQLTPPPNLQELYLRRYRHEIMPKWINPEKLSSLQYLCIENGDLASIHMSPETEDDTNCTWNLEGLCLKVLPNLEEDWKDLERNMPQLHYVEVSRCFNLRNFPCPVDKPGVWRKNED